MVQISSKFFALGVFVFGVSAISLPKRTVAQVESDLAAISAQVTTLDTDINAFPATGGTITEALVLYHILTSHYYRSSVDRQSTQLREI